MFRSLALVFSLLTSFMVLSNTTAAVAATGGGYYSVVPATAPEAGKSVLKGLVWNCDGAACVAGHGTSRPAIVCASVARELGVLTAFRAGDENFDAEALAKCNAKAKGGNTALANK